MSGVISSRWKILKSLLKFLAIFIWGGFMIYALRTTPTADISAVRLKTLQSDVEAALAGNGWITRSSDESKFGAALLFRNLNAASVDGGARARIKERLLNLGWRPINKSETRFCKNEMLLTFSGISETHGGQAAITLIGEFDAGTIKTCSFP